MLFGPFHDCADLQLHPASFRSIEFGWLYLKSQTKLNGILRRRRSSNGGLFAPKGGGQFSCKTNLLSGGGGLF